MSMDIIKCIIIIIIIIIITLSMTALATCTGFLTFGMQATAPVFKLAPSMTEASISIVHSLVKQAP